MLLEPIYNEAAREFSPTAEQLAQMTRAERDLLYLWRRRRDLYLLREEAAELRWEIIKQLWLVRAERGLPT